MERNWWLSVVFLSAFMGLGGVASAAESLTGTERTIDSTGKEYESTGAFTTTLDSNNTSDLVLEGSGKVTFVDTLTITVPGSLNPDSSVGNYGLYITGGTNTFKKKVTAGYLTSGEGTSTNIFEGQVELKDKDRDPSGEAFPDHSLALSSGTYEFRDTVTTAGATSENVAFSSSASSSSTTTFKGHLDTGAGIVSIGYGGPVEQFFGAGESGPAKVILNGTSASITAATVNVYKNGVLQVDSDATITNSGRGLRILDGGTITTAAGTTLTLNQGLAFENATGTFDGKLVNTTNSDLNGISINGSSNVVFKDTVTTAHELEIMDGPAQTEFHGAVTAGYLAVDTIKGAGSSTNVFKDTVTLTAHDIDITGPKQYSLTLADGTNSFEKTVTTGNKSAAFVKSISTFNGHLDAGTGDVEIGFSPMLAAQSGLSPEFYTSTPGTVVLTSKNGSAPSITAANVHVYNYGVLQVESDAKINGNIAFGEGGTFLINAGNKLTVTGTADISKDAVANVRGLAGSSDIGKEILTAASITGDKDAEGKVIGFATHAASLYRVGVDGNSVKITGMNRVEDVLQSNNIVTGNSARSAAMTTGVLNDPTASAELRTNLSNAVQSIVSLSGTDHNLAKIATTQLFGENVLSTATATQTVAQNFSSSITNHQIQLRDTAQSSVAADSSSAFASLRSINQGYSSSFNPNRIWGGGFGAWTRQDDKDNQYGYKYNSGGFILGYDREVGDFIFGISSAYSAGQIKNNEGFTKTDVDTFNVGLYGSYNHCSGFFVDANVGLGYSWNKTKTNDILGGGRKEGKYRNNSFQIGTNIGYDFTLPEKFHIIPSVGVQYTHVHQKGWSEKIQTASQIANWFDKTNSDYVSIPVQLRINKTFELGECAAITPEIRGAWIYEAKDPQAHVRMGYVGSNASTTLYGIDSGRSRGLVGAGVKAKFNRNVDAFVDYNYEFRSGYKNHNVMAGLGVSF